MNNNIKGFQRTEAIRQLLLDNFQTPNTIIGVMEKAGITDSYKYVC